MLSILAGVFVLGGLIWLVLWYFVFSLRVTTDDAYVHGNQVNVAAAVPGTIVAVLTDDTRLVRAGQPLLKLDPTDAELNLASARHALQQAVRGVAAQFAQVAQAQAEITARQAQLAQAEDTLRRSAPLLAQRAVAAQQVTQLRNAVIAARAALHAAVQQERAARAAVQGADIARNPSVLRARDAYRAAWINLERHVVLAPVTGYVAQRTAQLGQRIQPGQPLMQVIPLSHLWVDANFKETQLTDMRIGQPVTMTSDLYGSGAVFHGAVVGLGAGTGSVFALLPPQNASGNWIKVVQRLPVRISIDASDLAKHPLRLGLSMDVDVDIRDRKGQVLAQQPSSQPAAITTVYAHELAGADAAAARIIQTAAAAATGNQGTRKP
ncbi:MAG: HlyD family efflux transporter periplasmic adaptor subunit [Metallibacterium scheffleri]|jgi:membrane fusion protein (multidrug efflux system)|uniref:HlyD family efflux transporter periplasmic adaptor subunit n=1 Tax=Metallibacterium scheffleri TaxID=993689 RepID=UPI0026F0A750|nr:HlyD family efflux transporter periplasmic adaptor subunit [Metallibacterium scheffleri]MCK9367349.1 HlyD family efflux transporter periplasmic adaptor subunit [Metallibacterium scheffleri]